MHTDTWGYIFILLSDKIKYCVQYRHKADMADIKMGADAGYKTDDQFLEELRWDAM